MGPSLIFLSLISLSLFSAFLAGDTSRLFYDDACAGAGYLIYAFYPGWRPSALPGAIERFDLPILELIGRSIDN